MIEPPGFRGAVFGSAADGDPRRDPEPAGRQRHPLSVVSGRGRHHPVGRLVLPEQEGHTFGARILRRDALAGSER